jgi:hypothetical protein
VILPLPSTPLSSLPSHSTLSLLPSLPPLPSYRLVTHHNSSAIASVSLSCGPVDSSPPRRFVESLSPHFIDISPSSFPTPTSLSSFLSSLSLDIIVDLTVLTYNGRIEALAHRPAPLLINYLGYPGPAGCRAYTYTIVDRSSAPPEIHTSFGEKFIYLENHRPYQINDMPFTAPISCSSASHRVMTATGLSSLSPLLTNDGGYNIVAAVADREQCRQGFLSSSSPASTRSPTEHREGEGGDNPSILLCSFNVNKKLEPLSFAGTQDGID